MFGAATAQPTAFGSAPAGGFGFGSTASSSTTPSFGGFGQAASSNPSTTSGFGGFGAPAASSTTSTPSFGGFGATTTASTTAPTSGFGFGSAAAPTSTTSTAPTTGFGSFGATSSAPTTNPPASGFGGFGAATTSTPATGFGGFGTTPSATANPTSSFGGFGSSGSTSSAPSSGFGGFGSTTSTAAPATSFGGFGTTTTTSAPSSGFAGFGATPAAPTSTFGGFGASNAPATSSFGAFGGSSTFGTSLSQPAASSNKPQGPIMKAIEDLQRSYAPMRDASGNYVNKADVGTKNDECSFKTVLLNKRNGTRGQTDQLIYGELLEQAERDNNDPENYVPVEELGIDVLKARFDQQSEEAKKVEQQSATIAKLVKDVSEANNQLRAKFSLLKMKQVNINKKVLSTMRKIEILRCHGTPIQNTELLYKQRLDKVAQSLEHPLSKLQDMSLNLALQEIPQDLYAEVDEEDLESLITALKKQSEGIENLAETLRKDIRDISIVKANLQRS